MFLFRSLLNHCCEFGALNLYSTASHWKKSSKIIKKNLAVFLYDFVLGVFSSVFPIMTTDNFFVNWYTFSVSQIQYTNCARLALGVLVPRMYSHLSLSLYLFVSLSISHKNMLIRLFSAFHAFTYKVEFNFNLCWYSSFSQQDWDCNRQQQWRQQQPEYFLLCSSWRMICIHKCGVAFAAFG